jgi:hypothetical protein
MTEPEYYENNDDVVENFDQLNEKYRNPDWIVKNIFI